MRVRVYTAGDLVRLYVNGKEAAVKSVPESSKLVALPEVPYSSGELPSVAFKNGQEIGSLAFHTVDKPARLRLNADRETMRPNRSEVAFVQLGVTDDGGEPIPDLIQKIDFQIDGPGELAAVGNANPKDVASFRVPHCRTFHGRCLAILRPLGSFGLVTLNASAEGLVPASIVVNCT